MFSFFITSGWRIWNGFSLFSFLFWLSVSVSIFKFFWCASFGYFRFFLNKVYGTRIQPHVLLVVSFLPKPLEYCKDFFEWGWTARNLIALQSIGRHFWQEINCSAQNLSTARIQLILAQPDSSSWQKSDNCSTVSTSWHFFLVQHINWKVNFLPIEWLLRKTFLQTLT